ncbi:MAG: flagellar hook-basal body complex protein [Opitutales bacterium]|nr:flagellar hook-basal body complex protein [Opitutales bacterium]
MALIGSLTSGVSAMQGFVRGMEVIGNNIANSKTTAFKRQRLGFSDSFSNTLRDASPGGANVSSQAPIQIGSGTNLSSTTKIFDQGSVGATGVSSDLAIVGEGFFRVIDPANDNQFLTRNGSFRVDSEGFLADQTGKRVLGLTGGSSNQAPDTIAPIRIDLAESVKTNPDGDPVDEQNRVILDDGTRLEENATGDLFRVNEEGDLLDSTAAAAADSFVLQDIGGTPARAVFDTTDEVRYLQDDQGNFIDGNGAVSATPVPWDPGSQPQAVIGDTEASAALWEATNAFQPNIAEADPSDPNQFQLAIQSWAVGPTGDLTLSLNDGSSYTRAKVLTQSVSDPDALTSDGSGLFTGIQNAGPRGMETWDIGNTISSANLEQHSPGSQGLGFIQGGSLEGSNTDLTFEFSEMITTQRAFQAGSRVITVSDEMLQEIINLKR